MLGLTNSECANSLELAPICFATTTISYLSKHGRSNWQCFAPFPDGCCAQPLILGKSCKKSTVLLFSAARISHPKARSLFFPRSLLYEAPIFASAKRQRRRHFLGEKQKRHGSAQKACSDFDRSNERGSFSFLSWPWKRMRSIRRDDDVKLLHK